MKISVILAHPDKGSFNHAIADAVIDQLKQSCHDIFFHDLYAEKFDPILPKEEFPKNASLPLEIEKHCREISEAEGIIIIHPNWWGQPPAILKGWVDRIIRPGVAYEFIEEDKGEGVPSGLLKADLALVFNTSNTETVRENKIFGDPLEAIWKNCIFELCGVKKFYRQTFNIIITSTENKRKEWLGEVRQTVAKFF
jgi:putative NADPH-quinone reductase